VPKSPEQNEAILIIMEYIEGKQADWEDFVQLSQAEQKLYLARLAEQFKALRSILSEGYYGRVNGQLFDPCTRPLIIRYKDLFGPYTSYEAIVDAMYRSMELAMDQSAMTPYATTWHPYYASTVARFKDILMRSPASKPVLTQLDPQNENFIARTVRDGEGKIVDFVFTFIDLEMFGWFPAFVQMIRCKRDMVDGRSEEGKTWLKVMEPILCEEDSSEIVGFLEDVEHFHTS
jgi:hypothetical protein